MMSYPIIIAADHRYLPLDATLREQLLFPGHHRAGADDGGGEDKPPGVRSPWCTPWCCGYHMVHIVSLIMCIVF
jgi:hypothetical protein